MLVVFQVKYDKMHQALYEKRRHVVTSEYEPNDEECDFPSDDETDDEKNLSKDMEEKAKIDEKDENKYVFSRLCDNGCWCVVV